MKITKPFSVPFKTKWKKASKGNLAKKTMGWKKPSSDTKKSKQKEYEDRYKARREEKKRKS